MKRFFLIAFLATFSAFQVQAQSSVPEASAPDRFPSLWVTARIGVSENGADAGGELTLRARHLPLFATAQHLRQLPDFIGTTDTPIERFRMTNVLAGVTAHRRSVSVRLSAGVGYVTGTEHIGWDRDKLVDGFLSRTGNFPEQDFAHVNVPIRLDALAHPLGIGGAGLFVQVNLNPTRTFSTVGFQFALGNLR